MLTVNCISTTTGGGKPLVQWLEFSPRKRDDRDSFPGQDEYISLFSLSATMVNKEGEIAILQCTYSTTESDYYLYWYRHYPDKQPEFIIWRYSGNDNQVKGIGFGNHFSAQLQKSNSSTSLSISELVVSDSAVYYCAFSLTTVIDSTASLVQKLPSLCT
uniref:Ig-like domain-containing protein n=1 Tax=Callorhinchus milii TaxID=7868 RepID=A0A4W3IFN7_CALMI